MTTNYSSIEFPRAFRNAVKAQLRALAGWAEYRDGLKMPSNAPNTRQEIIAAAVHFGLDLHAMKAEFDALPEAAQDTSAAAFNAAEDARIEAELANTKGQTPMIGTRADAVIEAARQAGAFEGKDPGALISEALANLAVHLTPYVADRLPAAFMPIAQAAVAGPRIVVKREKPVTPGTATAIPDANVVRWVHAVDGFGLRAAQVRVAPHVLATGATVALCDYAAAPKLDPDFVWNPDVLASMIACDAKGRNMWSFGPAGTGKTEGAAQYAANLRRPFVRIAIDRATEAADLIGQWVLAPAGGMQWQDGKLTAAFRMPYAVVLIDEPTLMRPGALAVFQTALDTRRLYLPGGEIVDAEPGIFIVAADNTAGVGDDTGRYVDTSAMNAAFLDRFALRVEHEYMSPSVEANMIHRRTRIDLAAARIMTDFAALTRRDCASGKMTMGITPRRLLAWADACCAGRDSAKAFHAAIVQGTAPEDRQALDMLAQTSLTSQHVEIDRLVRGEQAPAAAPVEQAPSTVGASFPATTDDTPKA